MELMAPNLESYVSPGLYLHQRQRRQKPLEGQRAKPHCSTAPGSHFLPRHQILGAISKVFLPFRIHRKQLARAVTQELMQANLDTIATAAKHSNAAHRAKAEVKRQRLRRQAAAAYLNLKGFGNVVLEVLLVSVFQEGHAFLKIAGRLKQVVREVTVRRSTAVLQQPSYSPAHCQGTHS